MQIKLVDLNKQYRSLEEEILNAIKDVLAKGSYILGQNVSSFEEELARYCDVKYAVGVASGTDALELSLRALGLNPGDEVITTPFTFIATAEAIAKVGAKPVFADIQPGTYNIDPLEFKKKITPKTKAVIPVHIYGQPCDMDRLMEISKEYNLKVIEDCCQAIGAEYKGKKVGGFGDTGCFSFFPSKNLSTYGDGGMIVTPSTELSSLLKMLRTHGSKNKYFHLYEGMNSRLDELHAAILRVKIRHIDEWNNMRRLAAAKYNERFKKYNVPPKVVCPVSAPDVKHVYHVYGIQAENRDSLKDYLQQNGVQTGIHYPLGLHLQEVYKSFGYKKGDFPITERVCEAIISLPMYPELTTEEIDYIVKTIARFYGII